MSNSPTHSAIAMPSHESALQGNALARHALARESFPFSLIMVIFLVIGVPVWFAFNIVKYSTTNTNIKYALLVSFVIVAGLNFGKTPLRKVHKRFYLYFLTLFFTTILALVGTNPFAEMAQYYLLIAFFAWSSIFLTTYYLVTTPTLYNIAGKLLDILGIGIALSVILSYVGPKYLGFSFGEIMHEPVTRAFGPFGDQVGFTLSYFLLRYLVRRNWLAASLCLGAIFLTGTRGAVITAFIGVLWLLFTLPRAKSRRGIRIVLTLIFVSVLVSLVYFSQEEGTVVRFQEMFSGQDALSQRTDAMNLGFEVVKQSPIFGVGYLGFNRFSNELKFYQYFEPGGDIARATYTTQNQYLQTQTDAGILGLITLLMFLFCLKQEIEPTRYQVPEKQKLSLLAASAWLVAMLLGNQGAVWLLPDAITVYVFFLVMALELSAIRMQAERSGEPEEQSQDSLYAHHSH